MSAKTTDSDIIGYGEAGESGPMTRGFLKYYEEFLLGKDPLAVDKLWQCLMLKVPDDLGIGVTPNERAIESERS